MSSSELPIIDVQKRSREALPAVGEALRKAYSTIGFGYVINHGVSSELQKDMFKVTRKLHALPSEVKKSLEINKFHRGFIPQNTSTLYTSFVDKVTTPNQSESFMLQREVKSTDPDLASPLAGPNQWPPVSEFKRVAERYAAELQELMLFIIEAFAVGLGIPNDFFRKHFTHPTYFFRNFCYPPRPADEDKYSLFGSAPHSDYGFGTLVLQDEIGGLQLQREDGSWQDIPPIPNSFVLNVGDTLHRWTNGYLLATPHRVLRNSTTECRYSIVFFFDPGFYTQIEPMTQFSQVVKIAGVQPQPMGPFVYGEYLMSRLNKNHNQRHAQPLRSSL